MICPHIQICPHFLIFRAYCLLQAKELLEEAGFAKDGQAVVLGGALIAGFCAAACSLPFDFVKTRIQKMEKLPDGSYPYKSPIDCAMKTFREEGALKFYTGFPTYCLRYASRLRRICLVPDAFVASSLRWKGHICGDDMMLLRWQYKDISGEDAQ